MKPSGKRRSAAGDRGRSGVPNGRGEKAARASSATRTSGAIKAPSAKRAARTTATRATTAGGGKSAARTAAVAARATAGRRGKETRRSAQARRPKATRPTAKTRRTAPAPAVVPVLTGRVALVTGGSRGIGRAIALALARAGADVAINYHTHRIGAEEVRQEIVRIGRRAIIVQGDVANGSDARRISEEVAARLAPVDILVNNAGVSLPQRIDRISERDWDLIVDTNLKSVFLVTQAVLPAMRRQRWGRIVNISSVAAQTGGIVGPHYAASKAGILGLTHSYAGLLAKEGITVNAIAPALIETDMVHRNRRATPDRIPIGRFGTVDEVADVAAMLACNGYITGQTINVNGGWFMS